MGEGRPRFGDGVFLVVLAKKAVTTSLASHHRGAFYDNPKSGKFLLLIRRFFSFSWQTLALIFVSPIIEKKPILITPRFKLREFATATISPTQIFVLPLLYTKWGASPLVGLPALYPHSSFIPLTMLFRILDRSDFIYQRCNFSSICFLPLRLPLPRASVVECFSFPSPLIFNSIFRGLWLGCIWRMELHSQDDWQKSNSGSRIMLLVH